MRVFSNLTVAGVIVIAALQFVRPGIPFEPATAELGVTPAVKRVIERDCYSCHPGERRLSWFNQIVPAYWLVRQDIPNAGQNVNFCHA